MAIESFCAEQVLVYQLPRNALGHGPVRADSWPQPPIFEGRLIVEEDDNDDESNHASTCTIRIEDSKTKDVFAACVYSNTAYVQPTVDSSRYFIIRIQNGKQHAWIGIGFPERDHAFDFNVTLSEFNRRTKLQDIHASNAAASTVQPLPLTLSNQRIDDDDNDDENVPVLLAPPPGGRPILLSEGDGNLESHRIADDKNAWGDFA